MHAILKPFLLRRVKSDVETSLPGKLEVVLYAQQSAKQQELNAQLKDKTLRVRAFVGARGAMGVVNGGRKIARVAAVHSVRQGFSGLDA